VILNQLGLKTVVLTLFTSPTNDDVA